MRCCYRFSQHRRIVAFVSPGLLAHIIWWTYACSNPSTFDSFTEVTGDAETPNWYMCITMTFGSMVAGATSEVSALVRHVLDAFAQNIARESSAGISLLLDERMQIRLVSKSLPVSDGIKLSGMNLMTR